MKETKSRIIDIPPKMEKYYGRGSMLHPSLEAVEALVNTIPEGFLSTIDLLAQRLAKDFDTDVTCPLRTGNAIKKMAEQAMHDPNPTEIPFWRVIRKDKTLINSKNIEFCRIQIEHEGFELHSTKAGKIKVEVDADRLFRF